MFLLEQFKQQIEGQPGFMDNFSMCITGIMTDVNKINQYKGKNQKPKFRKFQPYSTKISTQRAPEKLINNKLTQPTLSTLPKLLFL